MFRGHGSIHVKAAPMRKNVSTLRKEATQVYVHEKRPKQYCDRKENLCEPWSQLLSQILVYQGLDPE